MAATQPEAVWCRRGSAAAGRSGLRTLQTRAATINSNLESFDFSRIGCYCVPHNDASIAQIRQKGMVVDAGEQENASTFPTDLLACLPDEIFQPVADDFALVCEKLRTLSFPQRDAGSFLNSRGPERLITALHLLSAAACGYRGLSAIKLATALQLIVGASELHQTLFDVDRIAPHLASPVLAGDWAYVQAFRQAVELRNLRILALLIEVAKNRVEGYLLEAETRKSQFTIADPGFSGIYYRRTACLFRASSQLGAMLAGADRIQELRMANYGLQVGFALRFATSISPTLENTRPRLHQAALKAERCLRSFPDSVHKHALQLIVNFLRDHGNFATSLKIPLAGTRLPIDTRL